MTDDPAAFFINAQQDLEEATCDLFAITAHYELRRMNLNDKVDRIVKEIFYVPVAEHVLEGEGLRIRDYDPAVLQHDDTLWKLPAEDVTHMEHVREQLALPADEVKAERVPLFGGDDMIGDVRGFVARIETTAGAVHIFQKLAQNTVLKASRAYKFKHSEQGFDTIDSDAVFQMAAHADCAFMLGDNIYLLQPGPFEYIFNYKQRKIEYAEQKVYQISRKLEQSLSLPENVSLWSLIDGQKQLINKLQKLDIENMLTEEEVRMTNEEFNLKIEENDDGKLEIGNRADAKKLINALNEDYLESIRGNKFETHSKERVEGS